MRLDMRSRKAIMANTCQDYQRADKRGRGEILDRFGSRNRYEQGLPGGRSGAVWEGRAGRGM
jgi:hypothetical protein